MNSIFYHLDCFKTPLTYRINGRQNFFTKCGCLMSVPLLGFLALSFMLSDLVLKIHPMITIQSNFEETRPILRFNKDNMTLSFRVTNQNYDAEIDPTYYSIIISNVFVKNTSPTSITTENKETKVCDETDFLESNFPKKYVISNATCISDNGTFEVGGDWTDPYLSYLRISILPCQNTTEKGMICKSPEEIRKYFKNKLFYIYFHDRNYDLNNYEAPINIRYMTESQLIDPNIKKKLNLFFKKVKIIHDEGFFTEENLSNESFAFEKMETDFTTDVSDSLFEVQIFSSRETQTMIRRYERVQNVIANLGGISYFMIFLEFLIVMTVREYSLMTHMVNYLYSFPSKASQKQKISQTGATAVGNNFTKETYENVVDSDILPKNYTIQRLQSEPLSSTPRKNNFISPKKIIDETPDMNSVEKEFIENAFLPTGQHFNLPTTNRILGNVVVKVLPNETFDSFEEFQQQEHQNKKLDISFWEYSKIKIATWCSCLKMSYIQRLFIKARKKALEEMDFFMILRKLQEIEKLKLVLLSSEQLKLFNLLSKPMIFDEKELCNEIRKEDGYKMSLLIENSRRGSLGNATKEVIDYYKSIIQNKNSQIDERLLALIEESMKCFSNHIKSTKI